MSGARPSEGSLPLEQMLRLVDFIKSRPSATAMDKLVIDFAALSGAARFRIWNAVFALRTFGMLDDASEATLLGKTAAPDADVASILSQEAAKQFAEKLEAGNGLQSLTIKDGAVLLDRRLLPGKDVGLPFSIIEFGVASRESATSRYWRLNDNFQDLVKAAAKIGNRTSARRKMTLAGLRRRMDENALDGAAAEDWVVEYEQRRLRVHPFCAEVRRISDEDVAAGFDIVSFATDSSLEHDRFIEVKSYKGTKRFFWSANEVAAAQELGEQYCLYIVDRSQMSNPNYVPHIIEGPYNALMLASGHGWDIEPAAFKCAEVQSLKSEVAIGSEPEGASLIS